MALASVSLHLAGPPRLPSMAERRSTRLSESPANSNITPMPSNPRPSDRSSHIYGYHNTFHTHARLPLDSPPPSYACANSRTTLDRLNAKAQDEAATLSDPLPSYSCSVELQGILGWKQELQSPFEVAEMRGWVDAFVVIRGTQLNIYRVKTSNFLSKDRTVCPGRLLKTYSLQHAEVGVASDFKKTSLVPKSTLARFVPTNARQKLFESDPHLFEPIREHVLRLRLETEQFLLCCSTQDELLEWVETLCAAIDISDPIDDRSEPRYRSLPRRTRRQRTLDSPRMDHLGNLDHLDDGRRLIAEQERIIRQLYPQLANGTTEQGAQARDSHSAQLTLTGDPEADDLDPADARFPAFSRANSSSMNDRSGSSSSNGSFPSSDPKTSPPLRHSPAQALRYRRRCTPILLATSPRVSDVVYSGGKRMRINLKEHGLVEFTPNPPRYDAHSFTETQKVLPPLAEGNRVPSSVATKTALPIRVPERPASPIRGISNESIAVSFNSIDSETFGYDLASSSSAEPQGAIDLDVHLSSGPPLPTKASAMQPKSDAAQQLGNRGKDRRSSQHAMRDNGFSAVAMGVGLL
ncbi:hypothetical protein GQ43DRAFT_445490, partial [Delitschia confertaspora ATCC 74209]